MMATMKRRNYHGRYIDWFHRLI